MTTFLKQSTSIEIGLGPFLDETDGKTAENGLSITQADIRLKKNAGDWGQSNDVNGATNEENGWYRLILDTTDTNTLGILLVAVHEAGALPCWREFMVVPANIYDSLVSGSDLIDVSTVQIEGTDATDQLDTRINAALDTILADSIPADGTRPTLRQSLYMLIQFMVERSISGTTVTVKKVDGAATLFTLTLSDATTPVSITRAT